MPHISSGSFFLKLDPPCCNTLICLLNFKSQTFSFAGERAAPLIYYIILLYYIISLSQASVRQILIWILILILILQASARHRNSSHQFYLSLDDRRLHGQWVAESSLRQKNFFCIFYSLFHLKWSGSRDKKARAGLKHKFHNSATFNVLFRQSSRQPKQDWIFIETSFNDLEGVFK